MFEHILVPLDGSPLAESTLPHAVALAKVFSARITLLQVISQPGSTGQLVDPLNWQMIKIQAQNYLESIRSSLGEIGLRADIELIDGQPATTIIDYAHHAKVDLIAMSSHGRSGLSVWNVSSVVQKITQRAHLPILIVRAFQAQPAKLEGQTYRKILIPLDSSQRAECALPIVSRLARDFQARLLVAHVVQRPEMPHQTPLSAVELELAERLTERNTQAATKYLQQIEHRLSSKSIEVELRLMVRNDPAAGLHDLVDEADVDLVVLSAHGEHGKRKWPYGNVVEKFITYGATPLLIYQDFKPDELNMTQAEATLIQSKGH